MVVKAAKTYTEFVDIVTSSDKHILVDAYTTWCGPCKRLAPLLEELSVKYTNVQFIKVDCEEVTEFLDYYKIKKFPTLFLLNGGSIELVSGRKTVIGPNISEIEQLLNGVLMPKINDDF